MKTVLIDTGPLYALADKNDSWHARVVSFVESVAPRLIVPITVLPEACYLIAKFLGSEAEIELADSVRRGEVAVETLTKPDWSRTLEVMRKYADVELQVRGLRRRARGEGEELYMFEIKPSKSSLDRLRPPGAD